LIGVEFLKYEIISEIKEDEEEKAAKTERNLVHRVEIRRVTVEKSVRIILVFPNGGNRGMAPLGDDAPQRPTVYEVSP